VVAWLTDSFLENTSRTSRPYERLEALIASVPPGSDGLLVLPLLAGERCPHDRPKARGVVYGLTFSHGLGHLARATLEGIAYVLQTVQQMLAGEDKLDLVLTGGMSSSPVWLQLTADFFGLPLLVPKTAETSAWGAVLLGLRAVGALQSLQQIEPYVEVGQTIVPDPQTHAVYAGVRRSLDALYRRLYVGGQTELDAPG
jgi:sugar (pentulose or hexulose) kinase